MQENCPSPLDNFGAMCHCTIYLVQTARTRRLCEAGGSTMFMHVDPSNGIAIYDQIVRQVKFAIASEALKPGNLVPSVREMARDLTVNPNTVARAYRELQVDNVLTPLRGTGLEVASDAYKKCLQERAALIRAPPAQRARGGAAKRAGSARGPPAGGRRGLARLDSEKEKS